jgi:hypothetical protein
MTAICGSLEIASRRGMGMGTAVTLRIPAGLSGADE